MTALLALVRTDLRMFFGDRRALIMALLVPIGIASFIGTLTGGASGKPKSGGVTLWLVDEDDSAVSRGVVRGFATDANFRVTVTNAVAARERVLAGKVPVALVLPRGLGRDALAGLFDTNRRPAVVLWHDPSRAMERQMIEGMLVPKVISAVAEHTFTRERLREFLDEGRRNLETATGLSLVERRLYRELMDRSVQWLEVRFPARPAGETNTDARPFEFPLPFRVEAEALTRGAEAEYNGYAHSFAGMGLQFVLMSMVELGLGLLRDRESGMFRRLRAAPLGRGTLLAAKTVSFTIIGLVSLVACFAFAMLVFGVRVHGSWPGFLACLLLQAAMAASLGLMLAAVGRTAGGMRGMAIAVILLLVMLGGAWIPTFVFPPWLQNISLFTPTRWAVDGLDAMTWRGLGWEGAVGPLAAMAGWTVLFGALAWWRFRWDVE